MIQYTFVKGLRAPPDYQIPTITLNRFDLYYVLFSLLTIRFLGCFSVSNSSSRSEQLMARLVFSVCRRNIEVPELLREDDISASEPQNEEVEFSLGLRRRGIRKAGGFKSSAVKEESPDE